ncbi:MAG: YihA family ribosome biogenesis GTP-binding protein [Flavobacteriales bacterium]|jgi:GTP-binding protein|nr:YihA family ribosome biogenesis GTP-binding protein [Flavobacteriales bacterium]MBT5699512.1 YihA family ribosome biogenesis GTP-binding protein [Flavobacteriales bacterium]MBT6815224.1 YihA family ribosome biogenesis GTP-binding protein [Flavobacteriales bacterium]MBT7726101.1 YihA family ribosome biogenesis GTP-binding protein [Flavobacteriales bacterium]MDG2058740.1 ribosome biogenesis GTP-binding protein YihA/YsxC [Flavobacteriales bacterium]
MKIKSAEFVISNTDYKLCPKETHPEYAFIGRSNVGKSSLINALVNRKNLAKTSGKPGKTQLINHFKINDSWFLVDLPGYGYASTSKTNREMFKEMINKYLLNRKNLICLFVLLDIRHNPQSIDLEFMEKMGQEKIPFVMVFTKSDKISQTQISKNIKLYKTEMLKQWEYLPDMFITSSENQNGISEILKFIEEYNEEFNPTLIQ